MHTKLNYFTSKSSLVWDVKQGRLAVSHDVSGQPVGPIFKFLGLLDT